jgi:hypothetical protein
MTRKALARRIAEVLFNEPATRRGAGAAPTALVGSVSCAGEHRQVYVISLLS